jgi:hypothetical protein
MQRSPQVPHSTPDAIVILTGCRPWPLEWGDVCPCCGGLTAKQKRRLEYCAWCETASPPLARLAVYHEVRLDAPGADRQREAERKARRRFRGRYRSILTERERRRIHNGYRGAFEHPINELTNLARVGREWLRSIGQEPDWTLILDKKGNVIGRKEPPDREGTP